MTDDRRRRFEQVYAVHHAAILGYALRRTGRDGTVRVTIREMDDPAGLQAKLRADGVRVVVTASLDPPAACSEWRGGKYRMGDQVLQDLNRTGLPTADGTEFIIRPSLIPAEALLWLGISQTGKPNGVVGPPGPMGAGYLTATQACAHS